MHRIRIVLLALASLFVTSSAFAKLTVVTTTPDLAALASKIAGDRASVSSLALPTQDPHWVDARPHLALALSKADLLIAVGADLEVGWLPTLQTGARNGAIQTGGAGFLDAATLVELTEVPVGKVDRSMGDIHPQGNPHFLLDPRLAERVAIGIGKRLAALDPPGRDAYLENTKRCVAEIREARARWETALAPLKGRDVFAYHRSLPYLAGWLGLKLLDHVEPRPGIPPDPRHVAHLVEVGKASKVRLILQESWYPTGTSDAVAAKLGAKVVVLSTMPAGGKSYVDMMQAIVDKLRTAL